jgi:7-carboxy-7-deazaguanine synthase
MPAASRSPRRDPAARPPAAGQRLTVNEIFYSLQGEAAHSGRPCTFVRLAACDLRCRWCDTAYAFHEGTSLTIGEILDRVAAHRCRLVEVTGGEPLLQPHAPVLVAALLDAGHEVLVETGGHRDIGVLDRRAAVVLDVKCPGSGESDRNLWENLSRLDGADAVKFVIADRADYEWSRDAIRERGIAGRCPVFLSPVHGELAPGALAAWILEDRLPVRLQIQLHKFLWGDGRGV